MYIPLHIGTDLPKTRSKDSLLSSSHEKQEVSSIEVMSCCLHLTHVVDLGVLSRNLLSKQAPKPDGYFSLCNYTLFCVQAEPERKV